MNPVAILEGAIVKGMSLVEFSGPYSDCSFSPCAPFEFPTEGMQTIRQHGAIPFLSWGAQMTPWDSGVPTNNTPNITLASVINGSHDAYIHEFAAAAAAWGHPFFLRFNWEMNGDWFAWSESANGNAPGEYVAAWRHVHDIFATAGASNATWTWCPNVDPEGRLQDLASLYPGDAYVDWTCLDGYNWGPTQGGWKSFDALFSATYRQITGAVAPLKPMMIGEMGSTEAGGSKAGWIDDALDRIPESYPQVRGVLWFDKFDSGMDWPVETSASATAAFSDGVQAPEYRSGPLAETSTGPILPPS
jgi:hypothetical protein